MKVIKFIGNYINTLNDYDMASKSLYVKVLGWIITLFISTILIWPFFGILLLLQLWLER